MFFLFLLFTLCFIILLGYVMRGIIVSGREDYTWLFLLLYLPIYGNTLVFAFQQMGSDVLPLFQYSKEIVLLLTFLAFVCFNPNIFKQRFKIGLLDKLFLAFIVLAFAFLILPIGEATFLNKAIYFKNICLMCLLYFLGRNTRFGFADLKRGFHVIMVTAVVAFFVVSIEKTMNLHLQSVIDLGGYNLEMKDMKPAGHYGLTWTFQAQDGQKRFGSIFANPLELASSSLLSFSVALILFLTTPYNENKVVYSLAGAVAVLNLMSAYSRASLVAFMGMIFFMAIIFRFYRIILAGVLGVAAMAIYIIYFAPLDTQYFVIDTITFQNPSSIGHLIEWLEAVESMMANPQGIGLATSGNAGGVSRDLKVGGENQFLIYGVQLGVLGFLLYTSLLLYGIWYCLKAYRIASTAKERVIPFVAATVKFGLLLPLFTANAESYLYVSLLTWWLVGASVRQYYESLGARKAQLLATRSTQV